MKWVIRKFNLDSSLVQAYTNCSETSSGMVSYGACDIGCDWLMPYVLFNGVSALTGTFSLAPAYLTKLRYSAYL